MDDETSGGFSSDRDEWQERHFLFPRYGLRVGRHGMRRRILWPGAYQVRWSRTHRCYVYRRC